MGINVVRIVVFALAIVGCTPRELAWLVPRASAGLALRTHEGQLYGAGFVTLVTPTERVPRMPRQTRGPRPLAPLAGSPTPCRIAPVCRWEARTRADALSDLIGDVLTGAP